MMEWYVALLLLMGSFFLLVILGIPIVFAFLGVNIFFLGLFMGEAGFELLISSVYGSLSVFVLLPITLFILMGEVLFRTGVAMKMIEALDTWLGRVPGRLALLSVASGTVLATLSGASIGTTAMLASTLSPAMEARGYKKTMSIGPLLGSGGLAIMIPPSALGVILAVIASVSVGKLLIAIIIPGLLLAASLVVYVVVACIIDPTAAPRYHVAPTPLSRRIALTAKHVLPLSIIIFLVIGVVFIGVATPTEAAALGTAGAFALAAAYRGLSWQHHSRGDVLDLEDLGDGVVDPGCLTGLHSIARVYRGDPEACRVGDDAANSRHLGHRIDARGDGSPRGAYRRHPVDHDDDPGVSAGRQGARI